MDWKIKILIGLKIILLYSSGSRATDLMASFCDLHSNNNGGCACFNKTSNLHEIRAIDVQCCCTGRTVLEIPQDFTLSVKVLIIRNVAVRNISGHEFLLYKHVEKIIIVEAGELTYVNASAFSHMENLQKFSITKCPKLKFIDGVFRLNSKKFLHLSITHNGLENIPKIQTIQESLKPPTVDLSHNRILTVTERIFEKLELYSLSLSYNSIYTIENYAISDAKIGLLKFDNNPLNDIADKAFANVTTLVQLDLSYSNLDHLPEFGLKNVQKLFLNETHNLKKLPSIFIFTNLEEAHLTYPYHCCLFKHAKVSQQYKESGQHRGNIEELSKKYCTESTTTETPPYADDSSTLQYFESSTDPDPGSTKPSFIMNQIYSTTLDPTVLFVNPEYLFRKKRHTKDKSSKSYAELTELEDAAWGDIKSSPKSGDAVYNAYGSDSDEGWGVWGDMYNEKPKYDAIKPTAHGQWLEKARPTFGSRPVVTFCNSTGFGGVEKYYSKIKCYPEPDALNPCEDVMGYAWLRIFIWVIWIASIFGNALVIIVLCATQVNSRMRVNHFLIMNLAFADLCIGVYLAMLAIQDVKTAGVYYNFAVDWQTGAGCKTAGFLSVFASELSIITMVLISFEVWYNTKYIFYGSRFQLSVAIGSMFVGYLIAFVAAVIPLTEVANSYSPTSTCLPLELTRFVDKLYLELILCINILAFGYIVFNYVSVYCMVAGTNTPTAHTQDMAIAKRMAILIITDFLCWAPTILFGVTAAADKPLISISVAKIFLVIFYPINAFANPFLYVFLTKMFRKDMSKLARKYSWLKKLDSFRRKKSSLMNSNIHTGTSWLSKKHSTPRSSNNSTQPKIEIRLERDNEPYLKFLPQEDKSMSKYYLPKPEEDPSNQVESTNSLVNLLLRRRPTMRRFFPQMSDIIENSNSNSVEDDQHNQNQNQLYPNPLLLVPIASRKSMPEVHGVTYWYNPIPSPTIVPKHTNIPQDDFEIRRASDSSSSGTWSLSRGDGSTNSTITSKISEDSQRSDCSSIFNFNRKRSGNLSGTPHSANTTASTRSLESGYYTSALPTPECMQMNGNSVFVYGDRNFKKVEESIL